MAFRSWTIFLAVVLLTLSIASADPQVKDGNAESYRTTEDVSECVLWRLTQGHFQTHSSRLVGSQDCRSPSTQTGHVAKAVR